MRTLEELIEDGTIWVEHGEYVAKDPVDSVVCSLWEVGNPGLDAAIAEGYGGFNK